MKRNDAGPCRDAGRLPTRWHSPLSLRPTGCYLGFGEPNSRETRDKQESARELEKSRPQTGRIGTSERCTNCCTNCCTNPPPERPLAPCIHPIFHNNIHKAG